MKPIRVQLSRKKGARLPPNTVNVARPTKWGNPYVVGIDGDAAHCIAEYRRMLIGEPMVSWPKDPQAAEAALHFAPGDFDAQEELRGKNLACWCKLSDPCHADVLLELANK